MKHIKIFTLTILLSFTFHSKAQMSRGFASLLPGGGQALNGDYLESFLYFTASFGLMSYAKDPKLKTVGLNIYFYNMYDAWRDAGGKPSEQETIFSHYGQSFVPTNIVDPFAISFLTLAAMNRNGARERAIDDAKRDNDQEQLHRWLLTDGWKSTLTFAAVGMGEEAFFRGFLFPAFSEYLSPWGGAIVSSALFSFAHVGATREENLARFIFGMIFCWQYASNDYKLGKNIFTHAWYDQILIGPFSVANSMNGEKLSLSERPLGIQFLLPF
ncbi:CPBP family intramembrane metalloprotease [Halobacteriovorax sp. GB3]|uniref:CPBP family intramembrane glutamic endopeptidase n=1 Tax=Halobacteriovorax sp. GB3 TaxID=2719615 RepID=UPI002361738C|nr:CPBP family intramembrane glutamic endopeptidase [Halobacteriovorax sp. GB3]MDD0852095.1 CPBP family intramembrane metalloprotease [Halobacteriovorax sp. GB3]